MNKRNTPPGVNRLDRQDAPPGTIRPMTELTIPSIPSLGTGRTVPLSAIRQKLNELFLEIVIADNGEVELKPLDRTDSGQIIWSESEKVSKRQICETFEAVVNYEVDSTHEEGELAEALYTVRCYIRTEVLGAKEMRLDDFERRDWLLYTFPIALLWTGDAILVPKEQRPLFCLAYLLSLFEMNHMPIIRDASPFLWFKKCVDKEGKSCGGVVVTHTQKRRLCFECGAGSERGRRLFSERRRGTML